MAAQMSSKPKILIVDDDDDQLSMLADFLSPDFDTHTFDTAEECVEKISSLEPSMVFLDMTLPGLSGLDACKTLKEISNAKIVFMTGTADIESKRSGYAAGADDYIVKPFSPDELTLKAHVFSTLWKLDQNTLGAANQESKANLVALQGKLGEIKELNIDGEFDEDLADRYDDVLELANSLIESFRVKAS